ncbi:hypothetical protein B0H16DRAFT_1236614, partial [Mycena metata]
ALSALFPDIEPSTLTAAMSHSLRPHDLYLLDPRIQEIEPVYTFNASTSTFEPSATEFRKYSTLDSIVIPLHNYFAILLAQNPDAHGLPVFLFSYLTRLQLLAANYDWHAALQYHTIFFNRRAREMEMDGSFAAWSTPDPALLCTYVYPHR